MGYVSETHAPCQMDVINVYFKRYEMSSFHVISQPPHPHNINKKLKIDPLKMKSDKNKND